MQVDNVNNKGHFGPSIFLIIIAVIILFVGMGWNCLRAYAHNQRAGARRQLTIVFIYKQLNGDAPLCNIFVITLPISTSEE